MTEAITGKVFNIEHYCVHDGPGIRSVVFLKGCPLSCKWCSNPESQNPNIQLILYPERCIGCGACKMVCPIAQGTETECTFCFECAEQCYTQSRMVCGKAMTVAEVFSKIESNIPFFENSGGGITVSGGEPLSQPVFLKEFLEYCKSRNIHTAIETCGYAKKEVVEEAVGYVDLFLYDLKYMDSAGHKELTGVDNHIILENFEFLIDRGASIIPRMPLIPGYNDSEKNLTDTCNFLLKHGLNTLNVLPYHQLGENKYKRLGRKYTLTVSPYSEKQLMQIKQFIESKNIICLLH